MSQKSTYRQQNPAPSVPNITYQELISGPLLDALADVFDEASNAYVLLERVGFPNGRRPQFTTPSEFWRNVCREIDKGLIENGLDGLFQQAAQMYPMNRNFRLTSSQIDNSDEIQDGINIYLSGFSSREEHISEIVHQVQQIARQSNIDSLPEIDFFANGILSFFLPNASSQTAAQLSDLISRSGLLQHGSIQLGVSLGREGLRDYLIGALYVEGPDQGRFQFSNIPASTPIREVGQAMINEYENAWPRDSRNTPRSVVVDHITPEGITERLSNPDTTLHENNVVDGDTLQVNAESKAAMVNQLIRDSALARVRLEMIEFKKSNPDIKIETNSMNLPTVYSLIFKANGWAPPTTKNGDPDLQTEHKVDLILVSNFPMEAPWVQWKTPIYHPNIDHNGFVCLGELKDRYQPGLHFGKLCQIILDIAGYRNYQVESVHNKQAARWAESEEGQSEIIKNGGKSLQTKVEGDPTETKRATALRITRL